MRKWIMASPLILSALDARTQAFPLLTPAQIERIRPMGRTRQRRIAAKSCSNPTIRRVPFFVLLSGQMEIVQPALDGERPVATHGPGEFTGEMTMISGQRCLVRGRVTEPGEFLELSGDALRSLVAKDAELSEILMRAFILRRLELDPSGLWQRHPDGLAAFRADAAVARVLQPQRTSLHLCRPGHRPTSQELLDRFEVKLVGSAGGDLPRTHRAAESRRFSRWRTVWASMSASTTPTCAI